MKNCFWNQRWGADSLLDMTNPSPYRLRPATPEDLPGLYRVCLLTGDSGKDGTDLQDNPTLLGKFFVGPYVMLEPDLAFTLEGPEGPAGYLLGALDTQAFNRRLEREWLPPLRREIRDPGTDRKHWRKSDWVRRLIHAPDLAVPAALRPYPAHAHIDLLPEARGHGFGSRMMNFLMARMAARGATGLHLSVASANQNGQRFYKKLGFEILKSPALPDHTTFMARKLISSTDPKIPTLG
jgi:ribosomal protein S18 acetylase RimI-like enzyme